MLYELGLSPRDRCLNNHTKALINLVRGGNAAIATALMLGIIKSEGAEK